MKPIDFYFDLSSPYSYLAATQLDALVARTGAEVRWRPVVLMAVFKAASNILPATSPPKARYMGMDSTRWAKRYGVPFHWPSGFPVNAMSAHRAICAAELAGGEAAAARLGRRLFDALWGEDADVTNADVIAKLATEAGLDGAALIAAISAPPAKERLRAHTDEAIARGMFGAPTFFVGDEQFWGNDRLDFVAEALAR
jgi:2-hydroxychromene-2-carboxylate isomerase